jgi:hypothetical protein
MIIISFFRTESQRNTVEPQHTNMRRPNSKTCSSNFGSIAMKTPRAKADRVCAWLHAEGKAAGKVAINFIVKEFAVTISEQHHEIYSSVDMRAGPDVDKLLEHQPILVRLIGLDPRGGYFAQLDVEGAIEQAMTAEQLARMVDESQESTVSMTAFKIRVMLRHCRNIFDNVLHPDSHSLGAILKKIDPSREQTSQKRIRKDLRLGTRSNPFINFRQDEVDDSDGEEPEEETCISRWYDLQSRTCRMLLSDGTEQMADEYNKGDEGFVAAVWLKPSMEFQTEVPNMFLVDGRISEHKAPSIKAKGFGAAMSKAASKAASKAKAATTQGIDVPKAKAAAVQGNEKSVRLERQSRARPGKAGAPAKSKATAKAKAKQLAEAEEEISAEKEAQVQASMDNDVDGEDNAMKDADGGVQDGCEKVCAGWLYGGEKVVPDDIIIELRTTPGHKGWTVVANMVQKRSDKGQVMSLTDAACTSSAHNSHEICELVARELQSLIYRQTAVDEYPEELKKDKAFLDWIRQMASDLRTAFLSS